MHRPRGAFCASGTCHQCPVRLKKGGTGLACELPADDATAVRLDPRRVAGRWAERLPPWFYERSLLRPAALRRLYLEAIRRLSAAPPLPRGQPRRPAPLEEVRTDALVIGAGAAGLAAAAALTERGLSVLVLEHERGVGGSTPGATIPLPEASARARIMTASTCLGLYPAEGIAGVITPDGPLEVRMDRVVIATGAYDRPLAYEGNDLPGTIGIRAFERLAPQGAFGPDARIGVFAAPDEAGRALAAASAFGVAIAWVAGPVSIATETAPSSIIDRLVGARGRRRLQAVHLERTGEVPTDVLVLGFTQPTYELQVQAGAPARVGGTPTVVVADLPTSLPSLVVGAAGLGAVPVGAVADAVERWLNEGVVAAPLPPPSFPSPSRPGPDAFVCLCEDVRVRDIEDAVAEGFGDAELVKRRTGAGTGACQGKYCLGEVAATLGRLGVHASVPTVRPPMHPVTLAELAVADA